MAKEEVVVTVEITVGGKEIMVEMQRRGPVDAANGE